MATRKMCLPSVSFAVSLLLSVSLPGCTPSAPVAGPPQVALVSLDELPPAARFLEIGNVGLAYRLQASLPVDARFPAPPEGVATLLPGTIRLFHFDEQNGAWTEVTDSRLDEQTHTLIGNNLAPGHYTAFGWSANPAENALQRLIGDAQRGFRPEGGQHGNLAELGRGIRQLPSDQRVDAMRGFLQVDYLTLTQTRCRIRDRSDCPPGCLVGLTEEFPGQADPIFLNRCPSPPELQFTCPQAEIGRGCCNCIPVQQRLELPELSIGVRFPQCPGWPGASARLCDVCPSGLSCPPRDRDTRVIVPDPRMIDFRFLHQLGLGAFETDPVLRGTFEELVRRVVFDPSPQPS